MILLILKNKSEIELYVGPENGELHTLARACNGIFLWEDECIPAHPIHTLIDNLNTFWRVQPPLLANITHVYHCGINE